jgi:LDH2 family malate/lactate/ureidoglycolate dehydrogenase
MAWPESPDYVQGVKEGGIDPAATPEIVNETAISAHVDGHKGFGLALSVDIFSRVLIGSPPYTMTRDVAYTQAGLFVEAIDIEALMSADEYYRGIDKLVNRIRKSPMAKGHDRIYLPAEPEDLMRELRLKEGIPIEGSPWDDFCGLAARLSVRLSSHAS